MDQIRVDGELVACLTGRTSPAEMVDAAGAVLGTFLPAAGEPEPTAEELDAAERNSKRRYSGDEVVAHLRGLG